MSSFGSDHDNLTASPIGNGNPSEDAGLAARSALAARKAVFVAKVAFWRAVKLCILLAVLGLSALGYYGWSTHKVNYVTDTRSCKVMMGGDWLTGSRTYSYYQLKVFGIRLNQDSDVEEKTTINLTGSAMTIVELVGDKWKAHQPDNGERGIQVLEAADTYVFMSGKKIAAIKYAEFCK